MFGSLILSYLTVET